MEFIVDRNRDFYFLEMNTRLQVEHPVTELVTGFDLVEAMIRIAAGEELGLTQADVRMTGWAVESRIYAEDPYRNFLPSVGRLTRYRPPPEGRFGEVTIRNDAGVAEGSEISVFYDPMIAKLCAHAPSRAAAIDAMADALDAFTIDGVRHNIAFLAALMAHPRWREGRLSTSFIADEYPDGFAGAEMGAADRAMLAAIAVSVGLAERRRMESVAERLPSRPGAGPAQLVLALGRERIRVSVAAIGLNSPLSAELSIGADAALQVETEWRPGDRLWRGTVDGTDVVAHIQRRGHAWQVEWRGITRLAYLLSPAAAEFNALMPEKSPADQSKALLCPMPGLVVSIVVAEGQKVAAGETLAIVEAMKMENVLRAERDVTVSRIVVKPGDSLAVDALIMEFA